MWRSALLSILLAVAGCGWTDKREVPVAQPMPASELVVGSEPSELPPLPALLPVPRRKPIEISAAGGLDPKQLIGLGFRDVEALLGEPVWRGERPPAKVWIYSAENCVLNIFFYPDINTREFRSLTYEIKGGSPTDEEEQTTIQCLARLKRAT